MTTTGGPNKEKPKNEEQALLYLGEPGFIHDSIQLAIQKYPENMSWEPKHLTEVRRLFMEALSEWQGPEATEKKKISVVETIIGNKGVKGQSIKAVEAYAKQEKGKYKGEVGPEFDAMLKKDVKTKPLDKGIFEGGMTEAEKRKGVKGAKDTAVTTPKKSETIKKGEEHPLTPKSGEHTITSEQAEAQKKAAVLQETEKREKEKQEAAKKQESERRAKEAQDAQAQKTKEQKEYFDKKSSENLAKINIVLGTHPEKLKEEARKTGAERAKELAGKPGFKKEGEKGTFPYATSHDYKKMKSEGKTKWEAEVQQKLEKALKSDSAHPFKEQIKSLTDYINSYKDKKIILPGLKLFGYQIISDQKEKLRVAKDLRELLVNTGDLSKTKTDILADRIEGAIEANKVFTGSEQKQLKSRLVAALDEIKAKFTKVRPKP